MQPLSYIKRKIKYHIFFADSPALLPCTGDISVLYLYYNEKTIVEKLLFLVYTTDKYLYWRLL